MKQTSKTALKSLFAVAALTSLPAATSQAETSAMAPNLIAQGRNMPVLNEQNLGETTYTIPAPGQGDVQFSYELKGYVFGLRVIRANYAGFLSDDRYAAYTDLKTSGLGALLKKLEIWAVTKGAVRADGSLRPDFHVQQNLDKKNRRVEMAYRNAEGRVDVNIVPPLGSQGVPPATEAERYRALDTVSALMNMTLRGRQNADDLCRGAVLVFDSKQHYNLRLEPVGTDRVKYLGGKKDAIHCHVYYEAISGYDPEDLPDSEEAATPVDVYFRYYPEVDLHVPVRFSYKISSIKAVIKMDELTFVTPEGEIVTTED